MRIRVTLQALQLLPRGRVPEPRRIVCVASGQDSDNDNDGVA